MKTISIPTHDRPQHLERVLRSIIACPEHKGWMPVFSCEPNDAVREIIAKSALEWKRGFIHRNDVKMGCWVNTFLAAHCAMSLGSELNLYLEDDYEISRDALRLIEQWADRDDSRSTLLCLRRFHDEQRMNQKDQVGLIANGRDYGLYGCGFAWRSEVWETIRAQWFAMNGRVGFSMWDISMEQVPLPQWRPFVNRSHGFGIDGTHCHENKDLNLMGPFYEGAPVGTFQFIT